MAATRARPGRRSLDSMDARGKEQHIYNQAKCVSEHVGGKLPYQLLMQAVADDLDSSDDESPALPQITEDDEARNHEVNEQHASTAVEEVDAAKLPPPSTPLSIIMETPAQQDGQVYYKGGSGGGGGGIPKELKKALGMCGGAGGLISAREVGIARMIGKNPGPVSVVDVCMDD